MRPQRDASKAILFRFILETDVLKTKRNNSFFTEMFSDNTESQDV